MGSMNSELERILSDAQRRLCHPLPIACSTNLWSAFNSVDKYWKASPEFL